MGLVQAPCHFNSGDNPPDILEVVVILNTKEYILGFLANQFPGWSLILV